MGLKVVLVKTKYPRNIGMVARALANFAVDDLILVAPQCEINWEAREGAARGQKPLRQARVYKDWQEFLESEGEGPRIAFSRRAGKRRQAFPISEISAWEVFAESRPIYLIFGPEDHGLSAEDLDIAHRACFFELPGKIQSMNISHAVVYALCHLVQPEALPAEVETIEMPDSSLEAWLKALNFQLRPEGWNAFVALKQMIMKAAPTKKEIQLLNNVIQQTLRKMREKS